MLSRKLAMFGLSPNALGVLRHELAAEGLDIAAPAGSAALAQFARPPG